MSNTDLKGHYHRVVDPALSLVFEISDMKRARQFYGLLQEQGTIAPQESDEPAIANEGAKEFYLLLELLKVYNVTIARDQEVTHKHEARDSALGALQKQYDLSEEDAMKYIADSGMGGFLKQGLTRFWVTTPRQTDLMRLHHDLGLVARRLVECYGEDFSISVLGFDENNILHLKTLDQAMARVHDDRFSIPYDGGKRIMTGMGPQNIENIAVRVVDTPDAFCQPAKP